MFSKYREKIVTGIKSYIKFNQDLSFSVVYMLILIIFIFLLIGLFDMQLLQGRQNLLAATRTSQSTSLVLPQRGIVYDNNGNILAYNAPNYAVYVDKNSVSPEEERNLFQKLATALDYDNVEELLEIYRKEAYREGQTEGKIKIISGINSDIYFGLVEKLPQLAGVSVERETQRRYTDPKYYSHFIGYIGKPSEEELGEGVYTISRVGKSGIEKVYDNYLRGKAGKEVLHKQYLEGIETSYMQENPEEGSNIYLTINSEWQKKLTDIMQASLESLDAFASAGVVMNSDTGEIKAMVSLPSYDNNLFVDEIKTEQYTQLLNDDRTPLLNRAIALQLPSGSIFKVVGATAALEKGVITRDTIMNSEGCIRLSSGVEFCEADKKVLGNLNVEDALSKSSNVFFCKVAINLNNKAEGINTILEYAKQYGLGAKTGIDLTGEQSGTLPSPELKEKLFKEKWYVGDDCNSIIGQGLLTVTPIQMAITVSAINNGGKILLPHILDKMEDQSGKVLMEKETEVLREVNVYQKNLTIIKNGMRKAAQEGSGSSLNDLPGNVIIKTGSADASELIGDKLYSGAHSWVMGCFEHADENYCFVVMQQWAGRGFQTVPVVKKFINCVQKDFTPRCQEIS